MRLLGAEAAEAAAPPKATPRGGRRAAAVQERALSPALVDHIVEALHGRCAKSRKPAYGQISEDSIPWGQSAMLPCLCVLLKAGTSHGVIKVWHLAVWLAAGLFRSAASL